MNKMAEKDWWDFPNIKVSCDLNQKEKFLEMNRNLFD